MRISDWSSDVCSSDLGQTAGYTVVRTPYDGIVASRDVEPGESVAMGQRLASVFSPDALRIEVELPQAVAEQLRTDPRGIVQLHDRRSVAAREVIIFPAADAATHTLTVLVLLPALDPAPSSDDLTVGTEGART